MLLAHYICLVRTLSLFGSHNIVSGETILIYTKKKLSTPMFFLVETQGWGPPSSKHVGVTPGTALWTIDVVKWFISDVLKVKWQFYRAFWTVKVNTWRPQPCVSSLQLDVGCPVVIAAAIPDAMLLLTDECFAQEVPEPAYDGLTCPKYAIWDSNRQFYRAFWTVKVNTYHGHVLLQKVLNFFLCV
jgi:hypothetical protein